MKQLPWLVTLGTVVCAAPALAQEPRAVVSVLAGWAFSEGVGGEPVTAEDGNVYDRVDPKSAFKWGVSGGVLMGGAEAGFRFGQQRSTLEVSGTNRVDVGDMTVNTYHGYVAYNFLRRDKTIHPYVMAGLGATHFTSVHFTLRDGQPRTIDGVRRFSTTWGAGVKYYASPAVGLQVGIQWTPTHINSDATDGWWCGPFWGCYAQFSNQVDFSGGITFRF